jgi:glycosyltransferase involved in cell wall biosynthesis
MMNSPLVSIIIPFHNHRGYIERSVANLWKQSYENWELLLVDNNSTDGSRDLALAQATLHPERVHYMHQPVQGIPFARNAGLAGASGKYVTFLDIDDEFAPSKLTELVSVLEAHPEAAMAYGLTMRVYLPGGRTVIQDAGIVTEGINEPPYLGIDWLSTFYRLPQTGATLVRASVAREVGGFAEELRLGNDDIAFHLKIALNHKVYFKKKVAVLYYRHSESEGARLNRRRSVTARYLEARESWITPYAHEYEERTGDWRPRYWAERAMVATLADHAHEVAGKAAKDGEAERRRVLREGFERQRRRGYLKGLINGAQMNLYMWLPRPTAKLVSRAVYRALYILLPRKYPLDVRVSIEPDEVTGNYSKA